MSPARHTLPTNCKGGLSGLNAYFRWHCGQSLGFTVSDRPSSCSKGPHPSLPFLSTAKQLETEMREVMTGAQSKLLERNVRDTVIVAVSNAFSITGVLGWQVSGD